MAQAEQSLQTKATTVASTASILSLRSIACEMLTSREENFCEICRIR
ncbi:hypothetical protein Plim_0894 [Planctopirus limnophila DSM 3776]|uniref:Uncharacterized protein n=1 Tax=Planctopirus limnophila (strain ATCC 43296 / DSM 3776 / IFAM 1008 / Mu 290) TaxID=521674 RepID=D5SSJ0_PLAL2|nr:hypothetical protein Plim_0894 [Planctopirus limnophila DSM 3776]